VRDLPPGAGVTAQSAVEDLYVAEDHTGEAIFAIAQREPNSRGARFLIAAH